MTMNKRFNIIELTLPKEKLCLVHTSAFDISHMWFLHSNSLTSYLQKIQGENNDCSECENSMEWNSS